MKPSKEAELLVACEMAIGDYLHKRWPYRHSKAYGVHLRLTRSKKLVAAKGLYSWPMGEGPKCSFADLVVSAGAFRVLGIDGLISDGRMILHAEERIDGRYVVWVEQSRGYGLKLAQGKMIDGHLVASKPKAKSRKAKRKVQPAKAA